MRNPFKPKEFTYNINVHTGKVRFIYKGSLLSGRIFGESYSSGQLIGNYRLYNILVGEKIYKDIPHHEIEVIK